jgi:hypothetical protein
MSAMGCPPLKKFLLKNWIFSTSFYNAISITDKNYTGKQKSVFNPIRGIIEQEKNRLAVFFTDPVLVGHGDGFAEHTFRDSTAIPYYNDRKLHKTRNFTSPSVRTAKSKL